MQFQEILHNFRSAPVFLAYNLDPWKLHPDDQIIYLLKSIRVKRCWLSFLVLSITPMFPGFSPDNQCHNFVKQYPSAADVLLRNISRTYFFNNEVDVFRRSLENMTSKRVEFSPNINNS